MIFDKEKNKTEWKTLTSREASMLLDNMDYDRFEISYLAQIDAKEKHSIAKYLKKTKNIEFGGRS
jgi:hypothetical protein